MAHTRAVDPAVAGFGDEAFAVDDNPHAPGDEVADGLVVRVDVFRIDQPFGSVHLHQQRVLASQQRLDAKRPCGVFTLSL